MYVTLTLQTLYGLTIIFKIVFIVSVFDSDETKQDQERDRVCTLAVQTVMTSAVSTREPGMYGFYWW